MISLCIGSPMCNEKVDQKGIFFQSTFPLLVINCHTSERDKVETNYFPQTTPQTEIKRIGETWFVHELTLVKKDLSSFLRVRKLWDTFLLYMDLPLGSEKAFISPREQLSKDISDNREKESGVWEQ